AAVGVVGVDVADREDREAPAAVRQGEVEHAGLVGVVRRLPGALVLRSADVSRLYPAHACAARPLLGCPSLLLRCGRGLRRVAVAVRHGILLILLDALAAQAGPSL